MSKHPLPIESGTLGERFMTAKEAMEFGKAMAQGFADGIASTVNDGARVIFVNEEGVPFDLPPDLPLNHDRHAVQRIPDLNPDDSRDERPFFNSKPIETPPGYWSTKDPTVFHETTLRETGIDLRCTEFRVAPEAPHNPGTCRDPACDCFPF